MDAEPPEQKKYQDVSSTNRILVFLFQTTDKQNTFISELCKTTFEKVYFCLNCEKKEPACELILFADNNQTLDDVENRISQIAYDVDHHEKNKWWIW